MESLEELYHRGYHQDFRIENRYCVLSEVEEEFSDFERWNQFKLGGATTLINTNSEASVLTNLRTDASQDNPNDVASAPGEGKVPTSLTEEDLSTWTKVSLSCVKMCMQ